MKLLVLTLTFIISVNAFSQNFEPNQRQFNYRGETLYLSPDSIQFKTNKFLRGWHWGGSWKMTEAIGANQFSLELFSSK